ncbi:class I SAM-dependent methyltransferase [Tenacibaculum sp. M341]|uniref:class I SAM-dependent methyltransferase n=1 Tax=Tenacibaculum sp. M341 TaxID=2530339 RepID=UPI001043E959|nr:class I SAM-dependent methyltransferase [Tenacibaculum sp. M341]TCI90569.1 class I SAM-dependent methyltransferase [Tenacibaculum sp. M341]
MNKEKKKPWATKDVMEQIYEKHLWGNNGDEFYSGSGSHNEYIVQPYIKFVTSFLNSFKTPLTVCDLGCGDFNIGKQLVKHSEKYIAVDIVPNLIKYNQQKFTAENLEFHCLNIANDELPKGDCALIRQVLQHLSNEEILNVTKKLTQYKYLIITEHLPETDFIPNKDIVTSLGIRLKKKSGVNLLASPFNLKITNQKELLSITAKEHKGVITTTLYTL